MCLTLNTNRFAKNRLMERNPYFSQVSTLQHDQCHRSYGYSLYTYNVLLITMNNRGMSAARSVLVNTLRLYVKRRMISEKLFANDANIFGNILRMDAILEIR